jgi:rod shape-determining protein MreD
MDQINFLGYIKPQLYVLFLLLYPLSNNRYIFMIIAFFMGLIIDGFNDTGGAHAAASLTVAFARPSILRLVYGESYEMRNIKVIASDLDRIILYVLLLVLVHHLVLQLLTIFDLSHTVYLLKLWLSNTAVTFILCTAVLYALRPKRKI